MRTEVLACRVPAREAETVRALAHEKGTSVSDELRRALRLVTSEARDAKAGRRHG